MQSLSKTMKKVTSLIVAVLILSTTYLVMPISASAASDSNNQKLVLNTGITDESGKTKKEVEVFTLNDYDNGNDPGYQLGYDKYYNAGVRKLKDYQNGVKVTRYYNSPFKSGNSGQYNDKLEDFFKKLQNTSKTDATRIKNKITETIFAEPGSGVFTANVSAGENYSWAYYTSVVRTDLPSANHSNIIEYLNTSILVWQVYTDNSIESTTVYAKSKSEFEISDAKIISQFSYVSSKFAESEIYDHLEPYIMGCKNKDNTFYPMISATLNKSGDIFEEYTARVQDVKDIGQGETPDTEPIVDLTAGTLVKDLLSIAIGADSINDILQGKVLDAIGIITNSQKQASVSFTTKTEDRTHQVKEQQVSSIGFSIHENLRLYSKNSSSPNGSSETENPEPSVRLKDIKGLTETTNDTYRTEYRKVDYQFQFSVVFIDNLKLDKKTIDIIEKRSSKYEVIDKTKSIDIASDHITVSMNNISIDNSGNIKYKIHVIANGETDNSTLHEGEDYSVKKVVFDGNQCHVTIVGLTNGGYSGTRTETFNVSNPMEADKVKNFILDNKTPTSLKVKWDESNQKISGYQLILTDMTDSKNPKTVTTKTTTSTSYTFSGLTPGHRYDVSIRVYLKGSSNTISYSTAYAYCLDNRLPSNKLGSYTASYTKTSTYTGNAIKPNVTLKDGFGNILKKDTDYTVSYSNNIAVGTGKITVTGKGAYSGTQTLSFTIKSGIGQVQNVKIDTKTPTSLKVNWNTLTQRITGYQLILTDMTDSKNPKTVATKTTTDTSYTFSGLTPCHRYDVSIRAYLKGSSNTIAYSTSYAYCLDNTLPFKK